MTQEYYSQVFTQEKWRYINISMQTQVRECSFWLYLYCVLSHVRPFVTPWFVVHKALLDKNTGMVCYFLLQGIFPTHGLNPWVLHCKRILYHKPPGKPQDFIHNGPVLLVIISSDCYNKNIDRWFKQKYTSHSSGGWEVQVQGASMNGFCWGSGL